MLSECRTCIFRLWLAEEILYERKKPPKSVSLTEVSVITI